LAVPIDLEEWALKVNSDLYGTYYDPAPGFVHAIGFDFTTGLGTLSPILVGAGDYFVGWFLDHELGQRLNG
jgi:hypothetical protein